MLNIPNTHCCHCNKELLLGIGYGLRPHHSSEIEERFCFKCASNLHQIFKELLEKRGNENAGW